MAKSLRTRVGRTARAEVFAKSGGRCHICGGVLDAKWAVDHVLAHASGGSSESHNLLAACHVCNRLRWNFTDLQVRQILKLGVYAQAEIRRNSPLGRRLGDLAQRREAGARARRTPR